MPYTNKFGEGFPPRSVAIVGVSRKEHMNHPGYTGARLFRMLQESKFTGRLYPVNPKVSELEGYKVYPKVTDIPERLDLVTITVPAAVVPQVLEDCVIAKARNVQICTSGFGETGEEEALKLEKQVREIALRGNLRVIGPNCMGFHIPSTRMKMFEHVSILEGPVAFISQSGGHCQIFLRHGPDFNFGFSKVISYGNALILDATDFLEYFENDDETKIICLYLEGIKDGRRFVELVQKVNNTKPVIIWKGGLTDSGARAASSHTGSLGGSERIWDAFFKKTGIIRTGSIEETAEVCMTILKLERLSGNRALVLSSGGGNNVATGDICAEEGVELPALTPATDAKLREFVSSVNQGINNPMDAPGVLMSLPTLKRVLEVLEADSSINVIIFHMLAGFFARPLAGVIDEFRQTIIDFNKRNKGKKAVVIALSDEYRDVETYKYAKEFREAGIAAYSSLRSACRALNRVAGYYQYIIKNN